MSAMSANGNRRILKVTPGNLRQHHLYVRGHLDFFPPDCIGPSRRRKDDADKLIEVILDGLNQVIRTDIAADAKTGRSRGFFHGRRWVATFFKHYGVAAGERQALKQPAERRYRLVPRR